MTLPAGTVTFLFTDVEGSTRLWEQHGGALAAVQERHDELLTAAVVAHGGHVVKTMGDGVMAAFGVADGAVAAAVEAQAAVTAEPWDCSEPIRVRMGLHTGAADPVGGDYLGAAVNRAARVADAANGGQIVASGATVSLLAPRRDVELRPLGHHRLRDLSEPLALFQVVGPGVPELTVPLRTLDKADHNLPVPRTTFVGREADVAAATDALRSHRLVTLTGLGGAGKTRLALRVAGEAALEFDGVRFAALAATPAQGVADALAAAVGLATGPGAVLDRLAANLRDAATLVVLDNCEHVAAEAACVVDRLLSACSRLTVLATSRAPLGIGGEHVRVVPPLALEDAPDAVELFVDRARGARAGFELAGGNRADVERVCRAVDGIPLAIELAAARVAHLSPGEIADRLEHQTGLLASRDPTVPDRHRTLTAALAWSHDLLDGDQALVFRRLGAFARPAPLDAVATVCGLDPLGTDVLDLVGSLVDGNLVTVDDAGGASRYGMLGTVRRFAAEQLAGAGETADVESTHARWCASLLDGAGFLALDDDSRGEVLVALERMMAAGEGALTAELAGGAWRAWELSGALAEGRATLERALAVAEAGGGDVGGILAGLAQLSFAGRDFAAAADHHRRNLARARAAGEQRETAAILNGLSMAALFQGDTVAAAEAAAEAVDRFTELDDIVGLAFARSSLAMIERAAGRVDEARALLVESLRLLRLAGRRREAASVLTNLGNLAVDTGDSRGANRFYEGALQLQREVDDRRGAALSLNNLSILAGQRSDLDRAVELGEEALELFRSIGDQPGQAATLNNLANVAREQGAAGAALDRYGRAAEVFRRIGDASGLGTTLANLADLARSCGEARLAWRSLVDAARLELDCGQPLAAVGALAALAELAGELGLADLAARLAAVPPSAAAVVELLDLAAEAEVPEAVARPAADDGDGGPAGPPELTARESQVVALVARGLANREIAEQLFVSERTVDTHISHVRTKLGITSRTQLTRWALERGLA